MYVQLLLFFLSLSLELLSVLLLKNKKKVQRHLNLQFGDMNAKRAAAAAATAAAIYGSLFCAGVDWRPRLSPGAIDV